MAGKKKKGGGYESPLDSIFKMAFTSNVKKGKLKPPKLTGVSAQNEFTKNLVALVAHPEVAGATKQMMDSLYTTFGDNDLLKFQVDTYALPGYDPDAGRIRVKAKDIKKFLDNPDKFVDSAFEKARKQRQTMGLMGLATKGVNALNILAWGRRNGLNMTEATQLAGMGWDTGTNASSQKAAVQTIAEIAAIRSGHTGSLEDIQKLSGAFANSIQKNSQPVGLLASKTSSAKKNMQIIDLSRSLSNEGSALTLYNKSPNVILATSTGAAGKAQIEAQIKSFLNEKYSNLIGMPTANLSGQEKKALQQVNRLIENDVARLSQVNDKILNQVAGMGYNISDPQVQSYIRNLNQSITSYSGFGAGANPIGDDLGRISNTGLMELQHELNTQRFAKTGDSKYFIARETVGAYQGIMYPGVASASRQLSAQYQALNADYARLKSAIGGAEIPNIKKHLDSVQKRLAKLDQLANRPGLTQYAPDWRGVIIGGQFADDDGRLGPESEYTNRNARAVATAMADMYRSQAAYYRQTGDVDRANQYDIWARNVGYLPGFDANVMLSRFQFMKGIWDSAVVEGGFLPAVFNGSLWDQEFGPSKRVKGHKWYSFNADGTRTEHSANYIVMPRDDLPGYDQLTSLYYLTPASLIKTFAWNGELFGYMGAMTNRKMVGHIANFLKRDKNLYALLSNPASGFSPADLALFFSGDAANHKFNTGALADAANVQKIMDFLKTRGGAYAKLADTVQKYSKSMQWFAKRYERFGFPANLWGKAVNRFMSFFKKPLGKLLTAMSSNGEWQILVGKFVGGKLGAFQLVEFAIQKLIMGLSAVTAPIIGPIIAWILTTILTDVVMRIAQPLMKIGMQAIRGAMILVIGLIFFILLAVTTPPAGAKLLPSQGVLPNSNLDLLPASQDMYPVDDDFGEVIVKPGQKCPVEGIFYCGAGVKWHASYSTRTPAIDITSTNKEWVAPMDGSVIDIIDQSYCSGGIPYGGTVRFQDADGNIYRLIHVRAMVPKGSYKKGTVIAKVYTQAELPKSNCWSGEHWHLDVISGGSWVDANKWYTGLGCTIPACYGD